MMMTLVYNNPQIMFQVLPNASEIFKNFNARVLIILDNFVSWIDYLKAAQN